MNGNLVLALNGAEDIEITNRKTGQKLLIMNNINHLDKSKQNRLVFSDPDLNFQIRRIKKGSRND